VGVSIIVIGNSGSHPPVLQRSTTQGD